VRIVFALILLAPAAFAEPPQTRLAEAIDGILAGPHARSVSWGVLVYDLANETTLYSRNESVPFIPASTTKLFTTALALTRLGPAYHFETRVFFDRASRRLTLAGGGDPTLSVEEGIEDLADQIRESGITVVGDVAGDESLYAGPRYADGWSVDDTVWDYGAPPSALTINENTLHLTISPAEPFLFEWKPANEFYSVVHALETREGKPRLTVLRPGNSHTVEITGSVPPQAVTLDLAIHAPAEFAAQALANALRARGVDVLGRIVVRRRDDARQPVVAPPGEIVAWRLSPQLAEIIAACNKRSQNLFAELLLKETGRVLSGDPGLTELKSFLAETGVVPEDFNFEDGSGLDRRNLVTPRAVLALLRRMHDSLFSGEWWDSLPAPGEEGTLKKRFHGLKDAAAIHAKTGTITHVSCLAGYAGLDPDRRIAFAVLANNHSSPAPEIRAVIDRIGEAILEHGAN